MLDAKAKNTYDVMIVGSGPAGATAARELVKNGYRVLVIEKKKLPRYKTCSGLIMDRAQDLLKEHFGTPPEDVFCKPMFLKGARLCLSGDLIIDIPTEKPAYNVWRSAFDHWLIRQSGADVLEEHQLISFQQTKDLVRARIRRQGKETIQIEASYLIGADGGSSIIRKTLDPNFEKRLSWSAFVQIYCTGKINLDREYYYMFFDSSLSSFYTWLDFKDDYIVYGVGAPKGLKINPFIREATEYMERFFGLKVKKVIRKAGCFGTDMSINNNFLQGRDRVLLVGEASGFMNLFGEGVSSAIATGYIAATAIHQANVLGKAVLPVYTELVKTEEKITVDSWKLASKIIGRDFLKRTD